MQSNSECRLRIAGSQTAGDKVRGQEETARIASQGPKCMLSGKGCGDAQTTRRLAQKPSFKECVTAH